MSSVRVAGGLAGACGGVFWGSCAAKRTNSSGRSGLMAGEYAPGTRAPASLGAPVQEDPMAAVSSRLFLVLGLAPAPALAGVHIVDATGRGDQLSIGAAVAAANNGDVLLVRSGSYPGFLVDDKALVIARDAGALVT